MSSYLNEDQRCTPQDVVLIKSHETGVTVYSFCNAHQEEFVHPVYAFNIAYFHLLRDVLLENQRRTGQVPHVSIPQSRCETLVLTSVQAAIVLLTKLGDKEDEPTQEK